MQPTPQELHAVRALIQRYCLLTASSAGQERPPSERYLLLCELKGLVARHLPEILDKFFPQRGPHTHANDLFIPFAELVVGETLRDACRIPGFKSKKRSIFLSHMPIAPRSTAYPLVVSRVMGSSVLGALLAREAERFEGIVIGLQRRYRRTRFLKRLGRYAALVRASSVVTQVRRTVAQRQALRAKWHEVMERARLHAETSRAVAAILVKDAKKKAARARWYALVEELTSFQPVVNGRSRRPLAAVNAVPPTEAALRKGRAGFVLADRRRLSIVSSRLSIMTTSTNVSEPSARLIERDAPKASFIGATALHLEEARIVPPEEPPLLAPVVFERAYKALRMVPTSENLLKQAKELMLRVRGVPTPYDEDGNCATPRL